MIHIDNSDIFFDYLLNEKRRSTNTVTSYKNDLNQFFEYLNDIQKTDLNCTYRDIRNWVISLDSTYKNKSIVRKIGTLKSYFKFLFLRDIRGNNPTSKLKNPRVPKRLPSIMSENEMNNILDHKEWTEDFSSVRDKLILDLLYNTGIRRDELIELKEHQINFNKNIISVRGKGNKDRLIPFNKNLEIELKKYIEKKQVVFQNISDYLIVTNKGCKSYPSLIYRTVKELLNEVSTKQKRSPHVLRHSYATHLLDRGADLNAIKELLGHSSLAATQVYTHNSLEKLKEAFSQAHPKA